jgi:protoporphyrinogen oxidase
MKKLAIIGGGVSGLTAAYEAGKKNIDTVLFEKSSLPGGRLEYCVSVTSPEFQPKTYELIKELGLEGLSVPFSPDLLGMFAQGKIMPYSELPKMIKSMPEDQQKIVNKIIGESLQSNFDPENPSENLKKLRDVSFAEYLKNCSPQTMKMFMEPMMIFTFLKKINMNDFSAEYGLFNIRFGMEMAKENVFTFEEGVRILADVLQKKSLNSGIKINLSSEVTKIEKTEKGFKIHYKRLSEEREEEAEKVLISTPSPSIEKFFPEIKIGKGISYSRTKCFLVEGKLKGDKTVVMGVPGNQANLRFLFAGPYNTHYIYPSDNEKLVDMDTFYEEYNIVREEIIENPFVILAPGARLSGIKSNIEGAYLCGDYYYYPLIETSISTAKKAVEEIAEKIN